MTQNEYLEELEKSLELLDEDIIEKLIASYDERISMSIAYENKTMADIEIELGTPSELAAKVYEAYKVKESTWISSKNIKAPKSKKIRAVLIDILVCSWLLPIMFMILLSGLGAFGSLPVIVASCFNYTFSEGLLLIIVTFGSYITLLMLLVFFAELFLIVLRNCISMNIRAFTPKYQTAARLVHNISIFKQLEKIKVGRNAILNTLMISISTVGLIFLLINTYSPDLFESFGETPMQHENMSYSSDSYSLDKSYSVVVDVGALNTTVVGQYGDSIDIDHSYNMGDDLKMVVDDDANIIYFIASKNNTTGFSSLINTYSGSVMIQIPNTLKVSRLTVKSDGKAVTVDNFVLDNITISDDSGTIAVDEVETKSLTITGKTANIIIKNSLIDTININNDSGFIYLNSVNNLVRVGGDINIFNEEGNITVNNVYFSQSNITSQTSNVDIYYDNNLYQPVINIITNGDVESDVETNVIKYDVN